MKFCFQLFIGQPKLEHFKKMCLVYVTELAEDTYETGWSVWSLWWGHRETSVTWGPPPHFSVPDSSFVAPDEKKEPILEMLLFI